jgi:hypothetical protein
VSVSEAEKALWTRSVLTVGVGRGFVVETAREDRFVITAGHCLFRPRGRRPVLPPCVSFPAGRTYPRLLGPVRNRRKRTVLAECVFVDPVADLAVLDDYGDDPGPQYDALVNAAIPLSIGDLPLTSLPIQPPKTEAWLLSLHLRWFRCEVIAHSRGLIIVEGADEIRGGMSGSPIVGNDGKAIGVVVSTTDEDYAAFQPFLSRNLPGWLLSAPAPPPLAAW